MPYLIVFLLLATLPADAATPIRLQAAIEGIPLGRQIDVLEDPTGRLTIAQVAQPGFQARFHPGPNDMLAMGLTSSVYWVRVNLSNASLQSDWCLQLGEPYLHEVDVYMQQDKAWQRWALGDNHPFANRPLVSNHLLLPLSLQPGGQQTIYVRYHSHSTLRIPLFVARMSTLLTNALGEHLMHGLFFGLMLAMMFYNGFVWYTLADRTYLYYVGYMLSASLNIAYIRGYAFALLWPHHPGLNNTAFISCCTLLMALLFTNTFLQMDRRSQGLHRLGQVLICIVTLTAWLSLVNEATGFRVTFLLNLVCVFYSIMAGAIRFRQGFKPAAYYLLGFGLSCVFLLVFMTREQALIPYPNLVDASLQIGLGLEAIILSLALAGKLRTFKREKEQAQAQALAQATEFSRQLISSQEHERKRIAADLHDSLGQVLILVKNKVLLLEKHLDTPAKASAQVQVLKTLLGQSVEEVRRIAYGLRPFQLDMLGLTRSLRSLCEDVAMTGKLMVRADFDPAVDGLLPGEKAINLYRIVQECLTNIIKHSQATEATVRLNRQTGQLQLTVSDNGRGIDARAVQSPKSGFGLLGLRERVGLLGGTLEIISQPGGGTQVRVVFFE
ncbi:signal transduction histidine kinase [Larkinella arboricola]|uniref:histidine kinase n=1 Tax=Larkinella arboricola TaxID=643671 RepID=A0A327WH71_LARAB|nr:7TM diverse intracellular signaling domain-containing protein [Larkinella arboricola]RAJ90030.1 signal transduction histidine kinase [Larkinella arboricola]